MSSDSDSDMPYAVIDTGSQTHKCGLSFDDFPRSIVPTCIGRNKRDPGDCRIGEEAQRKRGALNLTYPKADGTVNSWDDIEEIWNHCFWDELRICPHSDEDPDIAGVLLLDTAINSRCDREKMAQMMFETFGVGEFFLGNDAVLPVYAAGRMSALSVTSGHSVSLTVPVVDGYSLPFASRRCETAGKHADEYMFMALPDNSKIGISTSFDQQQAVECKHFMGTASLHFEEDSARLSAEGHPDQFPFGADAVMNGWNLSTVHQEAVGCAEIMFHPQQQLPGIHQCAAASLLDADADIRHELLRNVLLSGGNTMFQNYPQRMHKELHGITCTLPEAPACSTPEFQNEIRKTDATIPDILRFDKFEIFCESSQTRNISQHVSNRIGDYLGAARYGSTIIDRSCVSLKDSEIKVVAAPERQHSAWVGGSILASLSSFKASTISKSGSGPIPVYDEIGPRIVDAFDFCPHIQTGSIESVEMWYRQVPWS